MTTLTGQNIYSKASEVAAGVYARITAITKANGCETDIGLRVFRGRRNVDESVVPCAVLIEGNDVPTARAGNKIPSVSITQRYVVAAYVPCDADNPNDAAHAAIRDIKRAMFTGEGNFGGRVMKVTYVGRDIGPRADGVPIVFVSANLFDASHTLTDVEIEELVRLATRAPTAYNLQHWRFIAVRVRPPSSCSS